MPTFPNSLVVYAILVPGLVTVGVARLISNMPGLTGLELAIFLFLSSVVNLAICFGLLHLILMLLAQRITLVAAARRPLFLVTVCLVSMMNGVFLAAAYENAWINSAIRSSAIGSLGFTKYSPHSTLHSLMRNLYDETGKFPDHRHIERQLESEGELKFVRVLKVYLKTGNIAYSGYEGTWSSRGAHVEEIYLSPACRHEESATVPIGGAGVFIRMDQAAIIEFLDEEAADCARTLRSTAPTEPCCVKDDVTNVIESACKDILKNSERFKASTQFGCVD